MAAHKHFDSSRPCWFLSASGEGSSAAERLIRESIWQGNDDNPFPAQVLSIKAGDHIALRTNDMLKTGLPFDNRQCVVPAMSVIATGIVKQNPQENSPLQVDWKPLSSPRAWYLYTNQKEVWPVYPSDWMAENLIDFTFRGAQQNLTLFRNTPYWHGRFGDFKETPNYYAWTAFYQAVADKLLTYRHRRNELLDAIYGLKEERFKTCMNHLHEIYTDGTSGVLKDICPFTVFGIFNRNLSQKNRTALAGALAEFLGVEEPPPQSFIGIPALNNLKSCFFSWERDRDPHDIDTLWDVFEAAISYADQGSAKARSEFTESFDRAMKVSCVAWNLTMGCYWIRPWHYTTLDTQSRDYLKYISEPIGVRDPKKISCEKHYLPLCDRLDTHFKESNYSAHSFPELSRNAWELERMKPEAGSTEPENALKEDENDATAAVAQEYSNSHSHFYSIQNILDDGCFLSQEKINVALSKLKQQKNLILQGPPGTGKTWLARRLAYALIGEEAVDRVKSIQFHPALSYEDFVRGWRPGDDGKLKLIDGPMMKIIESAKNKPDQKFVLVIEEINRGHPAQIFGEMLTLLEADKRTPSCALELTYRLSDDERVFVPSNLYIIGTMNLADRSLAPLDLALRRRFAFLSLEPSLGTVWAKFLQEKRSLTKPFIQNIRERIEALNKKIAADTTKLGPQFRIGHSYVTPPEDRQNMSEKEWFRQTVNTQIGPLLEEYWYDDPSIAQKAKEELLAGL